MEITNLLLLLVLLPLFFTISTSFTPFTPTDNYLLNCGSSSPTLLTETRTFTADSFTPSSNFISTPSVSTFSVINETPSSNSPPLHTTARVFTKKLTYLFEINKKGTHFVRIHFFPFNSTKFDLDNVNFHVSVNGYLLLRDFSTKDLVLKEYVIWAENGKLEVTFTPSGESKIGFVNAIEVFSAPDDLIADKATFVSNEGNYTIDGLTHQAMESVYRITVGGPKVTPFNDTLWRTWIPDEFFWESSVDTETIHFGGRIKYREGGLSREIGPDNVYNSARVLSDANANITWIMSVDVGYRYLVRMHFCDIASMALNELYFNVYVNGNLAYENLDLSEITGILASPYYADFLVVADKSDVLRVTVAPSSLSSQAKIKVILNGLEVMKMNNSMGSFDGKMSLSSVLKNQPRASSNSVLPAFVIISLLMASFVVMYRRSKAQESVGWSPLPLDASKNDIQPLTRKFLFC